MLDIDSPSEVIAAAVVFARSVTAVTDRVAATTRECTPQHAPVSQLDHQLVASLEWIKSVCARAAATGRADSESSFQKTVRIAEALDAADQHGAQRIAKYAPI
ncbi:hypothetical protein [Nocardia iowensis]|uniref:Uncharacterized protein n=1 Tax=Nocardia iowensis TaxID=204891 RepID=A0ABX8RYE2_NOCIO|nr:hypothetical protein [Nocardia iowensis]QXN94658.1 hypothetical protein KV110_17350 [Nocardia iowensis]